MLVCRIRSVKVCTDSTGAESDLSYPDITVTGDS